MKIKFIKKYSELSIIPKKKEIFLYGIGKMGDFFYSHEYDFLNNFQYVKWIVSDTILFKKYRGCSVLTVNDIIQNDEQIIVVATTEMYHAQICALLERKEINECYILTEEYMASRILEDQNRYYDNQILNIHYAKIPNMGDLLNELLFKKYYGYQLQSSEVYCARVIGIGSSLDNLFSNNILNKILGKYTDRSYPLYIWGTGFGNDPVKYIKEDLVRNNLVICAIRGNLSKKSLENILGRTINCIVGDPGLLARELIDENSIRKKYKIGIIPHYREIGLKVFSEMQEFYRFSKIINLRDEPLKVITEIAECEKILTSSLHGAIVADAFEIPNILVKVSNIPAGDGFKYRDYYSGYGLDISIKQLRKRTFLPTEKDIKKNYLISKKEVISKIYQLKNSIPKFI